MFEKNNIEKIEALAISPNFNKMTDKIKRYINYVYKNRNEYKNLKKDLYYKTISFSGIGTEAEYYEMAGIFNYILKDSKMPISYKDVLDIYHQKFAMKVITTNNETLYGKYKYTDIEKTKRTVSATKNMVGFVEMTNNINETKLINMSNTVSLEIVPIVYVDENAFIEEELKNYLRPEREYFGNMFLDKEFYEDVIFRLKRGY